jgi:hypothetical protein
LLLQGIIYNKVNRANSVLVLKIVSLTTQYLDDLDNYLDDFDIEAAIVNKVQEPLLIEFQNRFK